MVIVGSKRMIYYEDTASDESVRVYDRGIELSTTPASFREYQLTYRTGDMIAPQIDATEPLALELDDFADSIRRETTPRSSSAFGLEIVRVLEAAAVSMAQGGRPIAIPSLPALAPVRSRQANGDGRARAHVNVTSNVRASA
jgi:predicted dehydrogenase